MAHSRSKNRTLNRKQFRAEGPEGALHEEELGHYNTLIEELRSQTRARGVADDIAIDRLALAMIRARRLDAMSKAGDKNAAKSLFYAEITIQNWLKHLGIDRRTRQKKDEEEDRRTKAMRRLGRLGLGGLTNGNGRAELEINRGTDDEENSDAKVSGPEKSEGEGTNPERPGSVLPGNPPEGTSPGAREISPKPGS